MNTLFSISWPIGLEMEGLGSQLEAEIGLTDKPGASSSPKQTVVEHDKNALRRSVRDSAKTGVPGSFVQSGAKLLARGLNIKW